MANLYESMNKYFESKYGDDLDNVKKVEKKSLNEALLLEKKLDLESLLFPLDTEGKMDKKEKKQMAKDFLRDLKDSFGLKGSALNIVLKWFFSDSLPAKAKKYYDTEKNAYSKYEEPWDFSYGDVIREFLSEPLDYDIFQGKDPKEVKIVKDALVKYDPKGYANLKEGVTSREKMGESIRSRRAMKEARGRTSGKFTVQKALLDAHLDLPRDLSPESQKTAVKKALDILKAARAAAETDAEKKQYDNAINILTNRPTPVAFNSLGAWYSGISMSEQMGSKSRMREGFRNNPYYHAIKRVMNGDAKAADIVYEWYQNEEAFEDFDNAKDFEYYVRDDIYAMLDAADEVDKIKIVRKALGEEDWDEADGFDESVRTSKFKINRRKVESLKSAPKRHKLGESKVIVSRKAMKEDLGEDIARYQRYVDYDMKHYGKISKKTQDLIDKAGLQVVKDQYGDYEVTAGHYEEACRSRKSMGSKKKSEITEAKEEKDLWDIIYGELTEDGSQYIVPETGKPRINKGAGYKFDSQIAVDRAGNIVVKTKEERDLKAAIDIADKHKDNGVTYNIDQSKYDKNYPYWMTIEIPEKYKECFKEGLSTVDEFIAGIDEFVAKVKDESEQLKDLAKQIEGTYYWDRKDPEEADTRVTYTFDGMDYDIKKGARAVITRTIWNVDGHKYSKNRMYFTLKELQDFFSRAIDDRDRAEETLNEAKDKSLAVQDIIDWIAEHDQLSKDFVAFFNEHAYFDENDELVVDSTVTVEDIKDWIYNHDDTVKSDFEAFFKISECFKESKLTEKNWEYSVNNSVSREFRDAIQSDDEDYERVRRAIIAVYDDIHENAPELLDDDDYEDWVTEEAEIVDLDDDDDVNYLLTNLYDFCDNANIWIGI